MMKNIKFAVVLMISVLIIEVVNSDKWSVEPDHQKAELYQIGRAGERISTMSESIEDKFIHDYIINEANSIVATSRSSASRSRPNFVRKIRICTISASLLLLFGALRSLAREKSGR